MHDDRPSTDTTPSPATLFVALDLSRSSWVLAVHAPHAAGKVSRHKLPPGAEGLLALVARIREQAERALGAPVRVVSCHEAGRDGFWLHRVLLGAGIEDRVIDPASLLVDRRARRAETDRLEAEARMALCRGEPRVCAVVRAPSVEEEDARRTTRERANLLKERVRHVNRIKVVFTQMTKADVLALGAGGQHVADLDVGVGDDHPVDQQQHELAALLEAGAGQPA